MPTALNPAPIDRNTDGKVATNRQIITYIHSLMKGLPTDYDVYDEATWSALAPLSEWSVATRSQPIDFPDFTKGKWKTAEPTKIMGV